LAVRGYAERTASVLILRSTIPRMPDKIGTIV
jgi:hypothetical protein